jgi:hypothetical protein
LGNNATLVTGKTTDDATTRTMFGNNVCLNVTALTGSDTVTITGSLVNDTTGLVSTGASEGFTINATGKYMTASRWYKITSIVFSAGITAITYDIHACGMYNKSTSNIEITGMVTDIIRASGGGQSLQIELYKIQDDGGNKYTEVTLEDVTINTSGITDNLRTGIDDRGDTVTFFKYNTT